MSRIQKFEDLIAWQKARALTCSIYAATRQGGFAKDYGLSSQRQRAAVSIMSNIAEGFERGSAAEYHHFLAIAKASCAEFRSQLYVAVDCEYIDEVMFHHMHSQAEELAKVVGGLRVAVDRQRQGH